MHVSLDLPAVRSRWWELFVEESMLLTVILWRSHDRAGCQRIVRAGRYLVLGEIVAGHVCERVPYLGSSMGEEVSDKSEWVAEP
jgi:hypothetical protein